MSRSRSGDVALAVEACRASRERGSGSWLAFGIYQSMALARPVSLGLSDGSTEAGRIVFATPIPRWTATPGKAATALLVRFEDGREVRAEDVVSIGAA